MKTLRTIPLTLIAAGVLAACSSMPARNDLLETARANYAEAQASSQVTTLAPSELRQAGDSLDKANGAWRDGDSTARVDHLAYLAKQQVAIAGETASRKAAELDVARAGTERDAIRLAARTREVASAQRNALDAQRSAEDARQLAGRDRMAADQALVYAQAARQQTLDAETRTRLLEAQLRDLEAKKTDRGMVITLGDVLFDTNQAQLRSGGVRSVQKLADFIKQYPQRTVMIEGFTDGIGGNTANQDLSERRADAVRVALEGMGIGGQRITSRGYGESYPVASNDTAAGRQQNRRVEMVVSDEDGKAIAPR